MARERINSFLDNQYIRLNQVDQNIKLRARLRELNRFGFRHHDLIERFDSDNSPITRQVRPMGVISERTFMFIKDVELGFFILVDIMANSGVSGRLEKK